MNPDAPEFVPAVATGDWLDVSFFQGAKKRKKKGAGPKLGLCSRPGACAAPHRHAARARTGMYGCQPGLGRCGRGRMTPVSRTRRGQGSPGPQCAALMPAWRGHTARPAPAAPSDAWLGTPGGPRGGCDAPLRERDAAGGRGGPSRHSPRSPSCPIWGELPRSREAPPPPRVNPKTLPSPPLHLSTLPQQEPTPEEEEEIAACDAWVAALVDAELADEAQEAEMAAQAAADAALAGLQQRVAVM